ncbi:hypothetical protein LguiA_007323 [Lonicera macranthoides]
MATPLLEKRQKIKFLRDYTKITELVHLVHFKLAPVRVLPKFDAVSCHFGTGFKGSKFGSLFSRAITETISSFYYVVFDKVLGARAVF